MSETKRAKSVQERIEAVLVLRAAECKPPPSVSELARLAGVSRANLYENHLPLIEKLRPKGRSDRRGQKLATSSTGGEARLLEEARRLRKINKALLLLNGELRAEISRLTRRLSDETRRKRSSRPS